jgi:hypothetical protein
MRSMQVVSYLVNWMHVKSTNRVEQSLFDKLRVAHLVNKLHTFHRT